MKNIILITIILLMSPISVLGFIFQMIKGGWRIGTTAFIQFHSWIMKGVKK